MVNNSILLGKMCLFIYLFYLT